MEVHRYRIKPQSGFATPLRSDTLYGHLLWAAAVLEGEERVGALIDSFTEGSPAFILSSAFPAGYLPKPPLPGIPRERFKDQFADKGNLFEKLQLYKKYRKTLYWSLDTWQSLNGAISQELLFSTWLSENAGHEKAKRIKDPADDIISAYRPHVSIDRSSGGVLQQGGLFFSEGTWYRPGLGLDLYVKTDDRAAFEKLLDHLKSVGFGANRTIGMGQFDYFRDEDFDANTFNIKGTHELSLSVCASEEMTGFDGYWLPMVKHGRAWSGFGETNPFKKPFFAFAEGSLFRRMPASGYLLRNIHSDPRIVQVGWPMTIPLTLEGHHAD